MSYPRVYLIRIQDRPFGFRVVAMVAEDEDEAMEKACGQFCAQGKNRSGESFAEIKDSCSVDQCGNWATFTFGE